MSKRILMVEDQPDNRQIYRECLPTTRSPRSRMARRRLRPSPNSDRISS